MRRHWERHKPVVALVTNVDCDPSLAVHSISVGKISTAKQPRVLAKLCDDLYFRDLTILVDKLIVVFHKISG
jgi:hypothetical protein